MFLIMNESPYIHGTVCTPECSLTMSPVTLPQTHISLTTLQKSFAFTMALTSEPLSLIQVSIVEIASTETISTVLSPLPLILIISWILAIFCNESTLTLPHANPESIFRSTTHLSHWSSSVVVSLSLIVELRHKSILVR